MANIDDFKANLIGGGARQNQFRVTITPPPGIAIGLDVRRTSFLVTASNLPAMTLTPIAIPFRGRSIYIAGDREFGTEWTTTFLNDTDFMVRNAMERWSNGINDLAAGTGVIAGGAVRTVLEAVGVHDVLSKSQGSSNPHNVVKATFDALLQLRDANSVARERGISLEKVFNG